MPKVPVCVYTSNIYIYILFLSSLAGTANHAQSSFVDVFVCACVCGGVVSGHI
jgi:hypothetical protein